MQFDLKSLPEGFVDAPFGALAAVREATPVCPQPDGSFLITRHADLDRIYRDTGSFLSDKRAVFGPKFGLGTPLYEHHTTSLVFNDPPLHARVRSVMVGAMTPRALASMEPGLQALVARLVEALPETCDLVEDFAGVIPIEVIGNLLDIPRSLRAPLRGWSLAILGALEPVVGPQAQADGNAAVTEFCALLREIIADRRARPGDPDTDVLTRLTQSDQGGGLSEIELVQNCIFILNAGHETTTNLIGNALALLDWDRAARARLLASPGLIPGAVEEVLRLESPNQFGNRLTARAVQVSGIEIPAGRDLHLSIAAANRDPRAFDDPDAFRPERRPNRHLAFGGGPHTCVGLTLARMEGRIALEGFLTRHPDYSLLPGSVRSPRIRFRGFARLPARLTG